MADLRISEMTSGGVIEDTDEIPINRAGDNRKVTVGTMAAEDEEDYLTAAEILALVNEYPEIVFVTGDITLDDDDHDGRELYVTDEAVITIPTNLTVSFRCSIIRMTVEDVTINTAVDSPPDTLNGVLGGNATMDFNFTGAYLRKVSTGTLIIIGGLITVA